MNWTNIKNILKDTWFVFCIELQRIFSDKGIIIIFFLAGLVYPILYSYIYGKENLTDVPVAVVDLDHSADSRRYRFIDRNEDHGGSEPRYERHADLNEKNIFHE